MVLDRPAQRESPASAIEKDLRECRNNDPSSPLLSAPLCLEFGTGSGFVGTSVARALVRLGCRPYTLLTDINARAATAARATATLNNVCAAQLERIVVVAALRLFFTQLPRRRRSLTSSSAICTATCCRVCARASTSSSSIRPTCRPRARRCAALVCRVPGLAASTVAKCSTASCPSSTFVRSRALFARVHSTTENCRSSLQQLLSPSGSFYVVVELQNRPRDIEQRLRERGLVGKVRGIDTSRLADDVWQMIARRRARNEDLMILKFWHER